MNNNIKEIETWDLIKELQSRGYVTELLLCRVDVQWQIDNINKEREDEDKICELSDGEMDSILESLSYDWHSYRLNEQLYDKVWEYTS